MKMNIHVVHSLTWKLEFASDILSMIERGWILTIIYDRYLLLISYTADVQITEIYEGKYKKLKYEVFYLIWINMQVKI